MEGYCLKDKKKVEMKDPKPITMKNGKPATVGTCPFCGTKIYRIGKSTVSEHSIRAAHCERSFSFLRLRW